MSDIEDKKTIPYTASHIVEKNLIEYSQDVVSTKYPHPIDGLKPVQRRLLYLMGTSTQKSSLSSLLSDVGKLHPAGDSSIYSAAIRLAQSFSIGIPLLDIPGSVGDVYNPGASAAPRYLEVESAELSRDLFFNGVYAKSIPMAASKDFRVQEPIYFIPRLPTTLYLNSLSIGYGFKSEVASIPIENICDIVMAFAEGRNEVIPNKFPPYKKIAKHFMPDFPVHGYIRNKQELLDAYLHGDFEKPILLDGEVELAHNQFRIRNLPFGTVPERELRTTIESLSTNKDHWMRQVLSDIRNFSSNDRACEIQIDLKSNTRIFRVLEQLKREFKLSDTVYPKYIYAMDGKMFHLNPYTLIDIWYDARVQSILSGLKGKQFELTMEWQKLLAYSVIVDHTDKAIRIVRNNTEDDSIRLLCKSFPSLTKMQARILINARLSTLSKNKKEELLKDIDRVQDELDTLQGQYGKVNEIIYNDAQLLKKKYKTPRRSRFTSDAIGYVFLDKEGVIQFMNDEDLVSILQMYRGYKHIDIRYYTKATPNVIAIGNNSLISTTKGLPKEFSCKNIALAPNGRIYILVFVDGGVSVMDNLTKVMNRPNLKYLLTTKTFWGIHKDGKIEACDVSQFSQRKSVSRGTSSTLIHALPRTCKDYIVVHMNVKSPNELRLDRILVDDMSPGRLTVLVRGETRIISAVPTDSELVYVGLDSDCLNMCSTKILRITNIAGMMAGKNSLVLELNKLKSSPVGKFMKKNSELANTIDLTFPSSQ